jgi:hypothetical protein
VGHKLAAVLGGLSLLAATPALARPENDVVLYDASQSTTTALVTADEYRHLMTELGLLISSKVLAPSNTLGANGFDMGFEVNTGLIHGTAPYWTKATKDGTIPRVFAYPTMRVRKGLPFSLEGGMTVSYLPFTQQQVLGGQARFAIHEGFSLVPDVAVQLSYDRYVGNEQLDMNVKQGVASIGYTWPFGEIPGLHTGRVSLWGGYGKGAIDTTMNRRFIQDSTPAGTPGSVFASVGADSGGFREFRYDKWVAGLQVESGHFVFDVNGEFVDSAIPTINGRFGATF